MAPDNFNPDPGDAKELEIPAQDNRKRLSVEFGKFSLDLDWLNRDKKPEPAKKPAAPWASKKPAQPKKPTKEGAVSIAKPAPAPAPAPQDPLLGSTLAGRYEVMSFLGEGGMSVVYRGKHSMMQREVAIKMLHKDSFREETAIARFMQEAQAASRLSHPNLIAVHDFGVAESGQHFLVMDFADGESLGQILDKDGPMPARRCLEIFIQICDGLYHAHENGVIHRDLKPGNVMVVQRKNNDIVKVVDFGVAKLMPQEGQSAQQLTAKGEIFGTSLYLSPEQCMGRQLDARSDIYTLGCVMYETLAGLPPFIGSNILDTMQMHINDEPKPFSEACPELNVPPEVEAVVLKTLAKKPEDRYQTMAEMKEALENARGAMTRPMPASMIEQSLSGSVAAQQAPSSAMPASEAPVSKGKSMLVPIFTGVAILALAALGASQLLHPQPGSQKVDNAGNGAEQARVVSEAEVAEWKKLNDAGQEAYDNGEWEQAEKKWLASLKLAESFGPSDKHMLLSLKKVADVYYTQGRDDEAKQLDMRLQGLRASGPGAVEASTPTPEARGDDSPPQASTGGGDSAPQAAGGGGAGGKSEETSDRIAGLAKFCHEQGQCGHAEKMLERSLQIAERTFGKDSPQVAERLNDLAVFYMSMGEYEKAEPLFKRVLSSKKMSTTGGVHTGKKSFENYAQLLRETNRGSEASKIDALAKTGQ